MKKIIVICVIFVVLASMLMGCTNSIFNGFGEDEAIIENDVSNGASTIEETEKVAPALVALVAVGAAVSYGGNCVWGENTIWGAFDFALGTYVGIASSPGGYAVTLAGAAGSATCDILKSKINEYMSTESGKDEACKACIGGYLTLACNVGNVRVENSEGSLLGWHNFKKGDSVHIIGYEEWSWWIFGNQFRCEFNYNGKTGYCWLRRDFFLIPMGGNT